MKKIFERLFETAEIAKFSPEEKEQYEDSLKSYRDLKNVIDTAFDEGENKGKIEEKTEGITKALKQGKLTVEEIAEVFSTTVDFVLQIQKIREKKIYFSFPTQINQFWHKSRI